MRAQLQIKFEVTAKQAQALLDVLRQVAGEDHFQDRAELSTFNAASDACRAALREALEAAGEL
jgi:hypothetical protein